MLYFAQGSPESAIDAVKKLFAQKCGESLMGDKVVAGQLSEKNDINMVMVYSALVSIMDSNPMMSSMPMMEALKGATLASSVNFEKGRIVCDAAVSYKDKESEQKMMDFYAYVKPQTGALLRYVPRNTIGAMAYGLDGEKMYSVFSAMPGYGMLMANPMVKQVMDAFSGDCVISFSGMTADGQYPVASLLAQVKDPAVLQTIVSNLSGMPIQKAGEGEYTISMGGVTVLFGVKGDVFYCTTDAVVKSALDGADIESLASMSKIFKGQSGSFYVDFEGVTALTAQFVGVFFVGDLFKFHEKHVAVGLDVFRRQGPFFAAQAHEPPVPRLHQGFTGAQKHDAHPTAHAVSACGTGDGDQILRRREILC